MTHNNNYASGGAAGLRLFTALWPDETTRQQIVLHRNNQDWVGGARTVADADLHVTLTFLGYMSPSILPALADHLTSVPFAPVELYFERTEDWGEGLVVLCPDKLPPALTQLHRHLQEIQQALGLAVESRPYRPHVTLARRARGTILTQPKRPIRWTARGFVLAQSDPPGTYEVLQTFSG